MFEIYSDTAILDRRVSNFFELVVRGTVYFSGENTTFYDSIHQLIVKTGRRKKQTVHRNAFLRLNYCQKICIAKHGAREQSSIWYNYEWLVSSGVNIIVHISDILMNKEGEYRESLCLRFGNVL